MSYDDWYDDPHWDYDEVLEYDDDGCVFRAKSDDITCKFCGKGPFQWNVIQRKWRLVDEFGNVHTCHRPTNPIDEFEDVSK